MVSSGCDLYASIAKLADTYFLAGANLDIGLLHTVPSLAAACHRLPPPPTTGSLSQRPASIPAARWPWRIVALTAVDRLHILERAPCSV
jgi:hypothetical protein